MTATHPSERPPGNPVASTILGALGLIAWIIPIFGLPMGIIGLVLGINATRRPNKGLAIVGVVLCSITLLLSAGNAAYGAYLGATGQHQLVNEVIGNQPAP